MTVAAEWEGKVGDAWAREWRRTDRSFADLSRTLDAAVLAAAPAAGRAVDLGCGAGATALALAAARPDLAVTGYDIAAGLIDVARDRAEAAGVANVRFEVADVAADAAAITADADLVVSRHGVMFYADPAAVFAAIRRAVRPDARLVFSCFRAPQLNPWAGGLVALVSGTAPVRPSGYAPGPFGFADEAMVRSLLVDAGWHDVIVEPVDYRYVAGAGDDPVADAVDFFTAIGPVAAALREVPEAERPAALDRLAAALQDACHDNEVAMPAAAWLWTARA